MITMQVLTLEPRSRMRLVKICTDLYRMTMSVTIYESKRSGMT